MGKARSGKSIFLSLIFLTIITLPILSSADHTPEWVDGSSISYPEEKYLVGVGYGNTRGSAEKNAYATISKIFSAKIKSISKEHEKYSQIDINDKSIVKDEINIEEFIEITSDKVLENIIVAETWYDSKKETYYVLAVIDRTKSHNSIKEKISSLDLQIGELIKESGKTSDKIQRIKHLKSTIEKLTKREAYNTDLRVIGIGGKGMNSAFSLAALKIKLEKYLKNDFTIGVEIEGEKGDYVRDAIIEELSKRGFVVVKSGNDATLFVKGNVTFEDAFINKPKFKFVRWTVKVNVIYTETNKVIESVSASGRAGHFTISEAKAKALKALASETTAELGERFDKLFSEG